MPWIRPRPLPATTLQNHHTLTSTLSELCGRHQRNYRHWHGRDYVVRGFMICNICDSLFGLMRIGGRGGVYPIATMLGAGRKGVRIPVVDSLISKHFPNGSAHPASISIRTQAPSWGQSGRSVMLTIHLPFTTVWNSVDMDKTLYRNAYIFIIIRYILNNFSVCIQSWELQQHTRLHISKYFIHLSWANKFFFPAVVPRIEPRGA
jgi:hypothetical protein